MVADVIAVITKWRVGDRQKPDGIYTQLLQVIQFLRQAMQITLSIAVAVVESTNVDFVEYCVLIPEILIGHNDSSRDGICGVQTCASLTRAPS